MQLTINAAGMTPEKMRAYGAAFPRAATAALNRMATQSRSEASRLVRERYNVKKSKLDPSMRIVRANPNTLRSAVIARGRRIPLVEFGAKGHIPSRPGTTGASVEVIRGRRLTIVASFLAKMPSGHVGVFVRAAKARLPIKQQFGPSVPQMFHSTAVYKKLIGFVNERLPRLLTDAVQHFQR